MAETDTMRTESVSEALSRIQEEDRARWRASLNKARANLLTAMRMYSGLVVGAGDAAGLRGEDLDRFAGRAIDEASLDTMHAGIDQVVNGGPMFPTEQSTESRDFMYVPTQETFERMDRKDRNYGSFGLHTKRLQYTDDMTGRMGLDDAKRAYQNGMLQSPRAFMRRQRPIASVQPMMTKVLPEIPDAFRVSDQKDVIGRDEAALRRMYEAASNDMSAVTARDDFERGLEEFKDVDMSLLPPEQPMATYRSPEDRFADVDEAFPGFAPTSGKRSDTIDKDLHIERVKGDFDFLDDLRL
jgi:hypothetical protein